MQMLWFDHLTEHPLVSLVRIHVFSDVSVRSHSGTMEYIFPLKQFGAILSSWKQLVGKMIALFQR